MEGSISYQRGDEWVFSISQKINFNSHSFLGNTRKNFEAPGESRLINWDSVNKSEIIDRIKTGLEKYVRVRDVDIKLEELESGHKLSLAYENYGYSSHAEAMSRILIVLSAVMPETTELELIHKNAGVPIIKANFPGSLLFDLRARNIRQGEDTINSAVFSWASRDIQEADEQNLLRNKAAHEVKAMLVYEPRIDQTLNEEYMDRWDIDLVYNGRYSHGFDGVFDVKFPIHVHADTSPGTGLWWEQDFNDKIRIQQAGLTFANHFGDSGRFWVFGEGGWLDEEWFGANFWTRFYGKNGNWWLGTRLSTIHDRDPYSFAGLTKGSWIYYLGNAYDIDFDETWRALMFAQAGYHFTNLDFDIEAGYGRFADGDKGWKFSVTRHWDDLALGFWYIDTDTHAPGKDFTRAGVHMEIPAERWFGTWLGNSSSHIWEQNTMLQSSWSTHSGRDSGTIRTPERMMSQLRPAAMKRNVENYLRSFCSYDENGEFEADQENSSIKGLLEYIMR